MNTQETAKPRRVIKRYSNRKLYDTKDSRYVTLLQIGELVRTGEEVQVVDNKSKDDLTEVTLAQILYEEQKSQGRSLPLATLKELIQERTERVLSDLREGPIGRFIPGQKVETKGDEKTPASDSSAPQAKDAQSASGSKPPPKSRIVEQARGTLEEWQHRIDDRVRTILPSLLPWQQLQTEVRELNARIDSLEKALEKKLTSKGE